MAANTKNVEKQGGAVWQVGGQLVILAGAALILPTADPHIAGALWNSTGTVTVSSG